MTAIMMMQICDAWQIQQDESQLKRIPRPVLRNVEVIQAVLELPLPFSHLLGEYRMDALLPHPLVGEAERLGSVLIPSQEGDP